ncbi:SDR family oxidoreductase [Afifella marina]|uniref:NADP-dependent 3-hydroxy acid dehydrogenase YdfG n=1 Tax=Afifella marina DSM 2698 TaxID=1120955 RepID=A0A1G5MNI7_AFIMA|nr:SDR family oxidoreductase [Afifella marina]MBK1623916.1 NAD(P)-dependent oxidoreductase [Afifella marina DSM 2698]MBK1627168.1 NAD(P)-dependent oxidoreductase [Afifella marina]MBK5918803.1 short-chain dehydrogenase [Afifella marina]RAI22589.1 short-chain dehydrogenase [Afifella marina DSM 2698]SCZ25980.1 NADP-dependent 3-hydroxy acid dehydrogenase YdfG [Afifella marina DSM 2698]
MKTFLITGASTGIGAATARAAVEAGYNVALAARSKDKLEGLVAELGKERALAVSCDVTSLEDQQAMVDKTLQAFGRIDVVFANAGVGSKGSGTEGGDPDNFREMILTNVLGVVLTAKVTLAEIKKNRGHILITGSRAGRMTMRGSVYGATKWAVTGYGQNLREELEGTGARVTLIEPGMVDTPFFDERKPDALKAEDVAAAVMYAVSQPEHVNVGEILVTPVR